MVVLCLGAVFTASPLSTGVAPSVLVADSVVPIPNGKRERGVVGGDVVAQEVEGVLSGGLVVFGGVSGGTVNHPDVQESFWTFKLKAGEPARNMLFPVVVCDFAEF